MLTALPRFGSELVTEEALWPDDFGFDEGDAAELDAALVRSSPRHVLQIGSGATSLVLAAYARATGAAVLTLEPIPARRERTQALLHQHRLLGAIAIDDCGAPSDAVDRQGPLPPIDFAPSLVLVAAHALDTAGLDRILSLVAAYVRFGAEVWLSKGAHPAVSELAQKWSYTRGLYVDVATRRYQLTRISHTKAPVTGQSTDSSDVVVTLLTGGRPQLAERTLRGLREHAPGLLERAHVVAFHNGNDTKTAGVLADYANQIDEPLGGDAQTIGIGEAVSCLAQRAVNSGRRFWLHLEDDWGCHSWEAQWLERAKQILDSEPAVHQIRLRHIGDRIQHDNFVTGEIVTWQTAGDIRASTNANWTFNPTLVRTHEAATIFPVTGEADAVRRARNNGLDGTVQLLPGAFSHLGLGDSLRKRLRASM